MTAGSEISNADKFERFHSFIVWRIEIPGQEVCLT